MERYNINNLTNAYLKALEYMQKPYTKALAPEAAKRQNQESYKEPPTYSKHFKEI